MASNRLDVISALIKLAGLVLVVVGLVNPYDAINCDPRCNEPLRVFQQFAFDLVGAWGARIVVLLVGVGAILWSPPLWKPAQMSERGQDAI